ncbi:hypothetical protein [Pseudarthrobacter sp. lyk4-40-TYG-27]|uniref:hypothetical protein n=1 Tax=Pseudarthrobacter sp. lyk4-40-TYG-27 TaxID=3040305 RepID=UPI00330666B6
MRRQMQRKQFISWASKKVQQVFRRCPESVRAKEIHKTQRLTAQQYSGCGTIEKHKNNWGNL